VLRAAACCRTALALNPYLPSARLSAEKAEAATNKNTAPAEVVSSADEEEPANDEGEGEPAQRRSARDRSKKSAAKSTPALAAGAVPRTKKRPGAAAPPGAGAPAAKKAPPKEKKKEKKEAAAKKSHAAAEASDGSDSCGQRQGNKAPKKNRKGNRVSYFGPFQTRALSSTTQGPRPSPSAPIDEYVPIRQHSTRSRHKSDDKLSPEAWTAFGQIGAQRCR